MDPLAGYAAVVATLSVGWQIYTWRHRRRRDLVVEVRHALVRPEWDSETLELYGPTGSSELLFTVPEGDPRRQLLPEAPLQYELKVVLTNRGETPQFVDVLGLRLTDRPEPVVFDPPDEKALPAATSVQKSFYVNALPWDLDGEFVGFAGIGEHVIESKPQTLYEELLRTLNTAT